MGDYFDCVDIHPDMASAGLDYMRDLLGDSGYARIRNNYHELGDYQTIEVTSYAGDEPEDEDEEQWTEWDNTITKLNNAISAWRERFSEQVEELYSKESTPRCEQCNESMDSDMLGLFTKYQVCKKCTQHNQSKITGRA